MMSTAVDDPNATVAQLKASTNEFFQAFAGFTDCEAVQIKMGLNGKMSRSELLQQKMSPGVRGTFNVFPACNQIDDPFARDKLHEELQTVVFTFARIRNLNRHTRA